MLLKCQGRTWIGLKLEFPERAGTILSRGRIVWESQPGLPVIILADSPLNHHQGSHKIKVLWWEHEEIAVATVTAIKGTWSPPRRRDSRISRCSISPPRESGLLQRQLRMESSCKFSTFHPSPTAAVPTTSFKWKNRILGTSSRKFPQMFAEEHSGRVHHIPCRCGKM